MNLPNIILNETNLAYLLLSILSLLVAANIFGFIFTRLQLPKVIGEILGGIVLGPSCLGYFCQDAYINLFNAFPAQGSVLSFLNWMGLILLMLTAGFKVNYKAVTTDKTIILNLLLGSTIIPIIGGILYYHYNDFGIYKGVNGTDVSMAIIVCVSVAITSIPVISKIFIDLNVIHSRFAEIILATATFHDLIMWIALDVAIKTSTVGKPGIILGSLITVVFMASCLFIAHYLAKYVKTKSKNIDFRPFAIGYILIFCLIMVLLSNSLGINIIFGALMAGIIIGVMPNNQFQHAKDAVADFSLSFFIPIYFAIVGLKIDLPAYFDLSLFLSFLCLSSLLEIGSVTLGMRLLKKNWLHCLNFGFAMNTRGGPGIVVASLAYEFSIIDARLFVALVLVAIFTSLLSGAWFKFILNKKGTLYEE